MPSATRKLAEALIARRSVTPEDAGCMDLIGQRLAALGFQNEALDSGPADARVRNLWSKRTASRKGSAMKTMVFAGHTDVVPPGPLAQWASDPFTPAEREGKLHGRGATDMKSSIAAFVVACEEFLAARPDVPLNIALLLTSDEEGAAVNGTAAVCETLRQRGEKIDYCIVGEPTSVRHCGDTIKNGRRGSLSGKLTVRGIQGHIAHPQLARNPIHQLAPALAELAAIEWDRGSADFPPTGWQISNIHGGTGAGNVIPGSVVVDFNFRFGAESAPQSLQARLTSVLDKHELEYAVEWTLGAQPFLTQPGVLADAVRAAIHAETGLQAELSTSGGTSDARFLAPLCPQLLELGPPGASSHMADEYIRLADLETLKNIYRRVLETLSVEHGLSPSPTCGRGPGRGPAGGW